MRRVAALCFTLRAIAESPQNPAAELPTRMAQLMESTAAAVPGLARSSESLRQSAEATAALLQKTPENPGTVYVFINQATAYLALSDSVPRPEGFPATAERQYAELREDLQQMKLRFEAMLNTQNLNSQTREADPANLKYYAVANGKLLPPGKLPRVVFLGDAITEQWRLNEYFPGRDFINRGIRAQTSLEMLGRFVDDVMALHPKVVVVQAGSIDVANGVAAGAVESTLSMIGDLAKAHAIQVLFASILPLGHASAEIIEINRWLLEYCRKQGFIYLDFYTALFDPGGKMQADLSDDGSIPNAKGYRVLSPIVVEAIGRALATDQNPPSETTRRRFRLLSK